MDVVAIKAPQLGRDLRETPGYLYYIRKRPVEVNLNPRIGRHLRGFAVNRSIIRNLAGCTADVPPQMSIKEPHNHVIDLLRFRQVRVRKERVRHPVPDMKLNLDALLHELALSLEQRAHSEISGTRDQ